MVMIRRASAVCVLFPALALLAMAAEFWTAKPYTEWTSRQVHELSSDSPWAKTVVLRSPNMTQIRRQTGQMADRAGEGEGTMDPEVDYIISLRTAEPIREAVVREAALQQKYDKMDAAARKAFDERWGQYLAQPVGDKVIFDVIYRATATNVDRELANFWQTQTLASTKVIDAYMIGPDGKLVEPIAFVAGKGSSREFQLAFPRPADSAGTGSIAVQFKHPDVTEQPSTRIYAKFNFKDMAYKGKLSY
jgi:hypothetical protein